MRYDAATLARFDRTVEIFAVVHEFQKFVHGRRDGREERKEIKRTIFTGIIFPFSRCMSLIVRLSISVRADIRM